MPEPEELEFEIPVRLAIFISGRGSNMMTLVDACFDGDVPAMPVLVLSNSYSAGGLEWASAGRPADRRD